MYRKIIVPLDGSPLAEQILPFARWLSDPEDIPIELLMVIDPEARGSAEAAESYLKKVAQKYFPASQRVTTAVERGKPADVIVERNGDPGCLIALATHGMSGMRRWLLGSVASKVVQTTDHPLLLIRPIEGVDASAPVDLKTIFVPLDGSGLAEKVLAQVVALAKRMKVEVHLIRVYTLPVNAYVVAEGVIAQGTAQFREKLRSEAEIYLDGKAEQLRTNGVIAMSTHGRSGIGRWMLGSVTEKIVQHSRDPVLVIRAT
jgi:nucleotide-binding universal stress UspA family protein